MTRLILIIVGFMALAFLGTLIWARSSSRPGTLGINNGGLSPCPDSPNCVSSRSSNPEQFIAQFSYDISTEQAQLQLVHILQKMPRANVVTNTPGYIYVESRSMIFGFIDDTEFLFDEEKMVIHIRSSSRLGYSDMGVNRSRIEKIRYQFNNLS